MIDPNYADLDIQAYESNLETYGICPYMSMGMSKIPCTDKCALYIIRENELTGIVYFAGCSHKLQAQSVDEMRFYKQEEYNDD